MIFDSKKFTTKPNSIVGKIPQKRTNCSGLFNIQHSTSVRPVESPTLIWLEFYLFKIRHLNTVLLTHLQHPFQSVAFEKYRVQTNTKCVWQLWTNYYRKVDPLASDGAVGKMIYFLFPIRRYTRFLFHVKNGKYIWIANVWSSIINVDDENERCSNIFHMKSVTSFGIRIQFYSIKTSIRLNWICRDIDPIYLLSLWILTQLEYLMTGYRFFCLPILCLKSKSFLMNRYCFSKINWRRQLEEFWKLQ